MSKDFSPQMHWFAHMKFPELHFSNIKMNFKGERWLVYTPEELEDRKKHPYVQVLASDIYGELRTVLTDKEFEDLNKTLQNLVESDISGKSTSSFPKEMTDWYFNTKDYYYHEPNDREFMEYIKREHKLQKDVTPVNLSPDEKPKTPKLTR